MLALVPNRPRASILAAVLTSLATACSGQHDAPRGDIAAVREGDSARQDETAKTAIKEQPVAAAALGATGHLDMLGYADPHVRASAPPPAAEPLFLHSPHIAPDESRERYQHLDDNPIHVVAENPVSTFSLDVDTGSYSNVRRFLAGGHRPPEDAVRVEELVNYFPYDYPRGSSDHPFGIRTDLAPCPWNTEHWLLGVAVRADDVEAQVVPPANLVFLVDVSGSMQDASKLPLLQSSLKLLVGQLRAQDRVSLVVYAGSEGLVLEPTPGDQNIRIERAIDALSAGGSTAGEAGIRLAYRVARQAFIEGGINRVLLATDGDFNVGVTDFEQLKDLAERERDSGVQLSTLGFGTGNLNEALMEQLADNGNGSYAYIDNLAEGRKVLVDQVRSTLVTVAKDVKVQVEFNPAVVGEYRLIGYENRKLAREDFTNDRIDAGDVGAGQSVTAIYELTPAGAAPSIDPLRYGASSDAKTAAPPSSEVAFVKLRYKKPVATTSRLVDVPVEKSSLLASFDKAGDDFRFAAAVAAFGQLLRGGKFTNGWTFDDVIGVATESRGKDEFGYRSEFLGLVRMAKVAG
jgi:Ca-activated chloride channel family protein